MAADIQYVYKRASESFNLKDKQYDKQKNKSRVSGKYRQKAKNGKVKAKLTDLLDKLFKVADYTKVPVEEREFLEDQDNERKMIIGGRDLCILEMFFYIARLPNKS